MKLPGIEYNTRVQDLGKHDIYGPIRAANAMARAASARAGVAADNVRSGVRIAAMTREAYRGEQQVLEAKHRANMAKYSAIGDFISTAYQVHADAELTKAKREYEERMALGLADLEKNKYDRIEQPDGTFKLVSRHDKLEDDYAALAKDVRDSVREGMVNPHAKMSFDEGVADYEAKKRVDVKIAASAWQHDDAAATYFGEYKAAMLKGDFDTANNVVENGVANELFSYEDGMKMVDGIATARAEHGIESAARAGDYALAFETLKQNEMYVDQEKGRKAIVAIMGDNILADNDANKTMLEKQAHYKAFMAASPDDMGITPTEHGKIAEAIRGRISDFDAYNEKEKAEAEIGTETQKFALRGGTPKTKAEEKMLGKIYEQEKAAVESPATAMLRVAANHNYLPDNALWELGAMIRSDDPTAVMEGVSTLAFMLQANAGLNQQVSSELSKGDWEKAQFILDAMDSRRTLSEALADYETYNKGKTPQDKEAVKASLASVKKSLHKDYKKEITKAIGGDRGFWESDREIAEGPMAHYFDQVFSYNYARYFTGDEEVATRLAIRAAGDATKTNWSYDDGWKYRQPQAMLPEGDHVYIEPELREFAKRMNVDYDSIDLVYGGVNEQGHFWYARDKDTGNFLFDTVGGATVRPWLTFSEDTLMSDDGKSILRSKEREATSITKERAELFVDSLDDSFDLPVKRWLYDLQGNTGIYEGASFKGMRDVLITDVLDFIDAYKKNVKSDSPALRSEQTKLFKFVFDKRFNQAKELHPEMSDQEISAYISTDMYESNFYNYDHYPETGRP